ncbi:MAG TPA: hypothetical protein VMW41_05160 [Candidatus Bathyarchaeia archaeon]|nr:hypothetical protein [Candidatus Bathyarchaeia archaeon]
MERYTSIIFSCLVFLITLFLSRVILTALGATFVFLFLMILLELAWGFKQSPAFSPFIRLATNFSVTSILVLSFYVLIFLPFEYQLTENWKLIPKIPSLFSLLFLLILAVILNSISWNKLLKVKIFRFLLLVFVVICGLVYREYRQEKLTKEYLPKIYKISANWGIQGSLIEIRGLNFFPIWKGGKVMLDNEETNIRSWSEGIIIAELPVPVKFGCVNLYLKRSDGIISNSIPFEIRNPGNLTIKATY